MADPSINTFSPTVLPSVESDRLIAADKFADKIVNMEPTPEGGLRAVSGPALMRAASDVKCYGIGHAVIAGKSVLIRQTATELQLFVGAPAAPWKTLTFQTGVSPALENLTQDAPRRPAVFIPTPRGMVIIPAGTYPRPLFFDGEILTSLGFQRGPTAPEIQAVRVESRADLEAAIALTDQGNRVGQVESSTDSTTYRGKRLRYETQVAAQWIDRYGNLSPVSARSRKLSVPGSRIEKSNDLEAGLFRLQYREIDSGGVNVEGIILFRTRNLAYSGDNELYEIPQHEKPSTSFIATIPSIGSAVYGDNTPDAALIRPPLDVAPVPNAISGALSMGSLWLATTDAVWKSVPGLYGTFLRTNVLYPDTNGEEITACHAVNGGLLVCTMTSSFIARPSENDPDRIVSVPVSSTFGCIAQNTMQNVAGRTIWLSRDGWVSFDQSGLRLLSTQHDRLVRELNMGKLHTACATVIDGYYYCWVPRGADKFAGTCVIFDGAGNLRGRRDDTLARSVCTTQDHRNYTFVAGQDRASQRDGILVLNRESNELGPTNRACEVETAWVLANGVDKRSIRRLVIWLRETDSTNKMTVEIMSDWRETVLQTVTVDLDPAEDTPLTWDASLLGVGEWQRRRPYYAVVDLDYPSSECIKFRFKASWDVEILGFTLQYGAGTRAGSWS